MTVLLLHTDDGEDLAAEVADPTGDPVAAAVLLHPHPQMGGDMHTPVPEHLFRSLPGAGVSVLRFDFRGAGGSTGSFGGGGPETADVRAAVARLRSHTGLPVWLVGWSFGADVSLLVTETEIAGWICVTPPLSQPGITEAAGGDPRPKVLLVAEHDQFCAPGVASERTDAWQANRLIVLTGADHFLAGHLGRVAEQVESVVLSSQ